MVFAAFWASTPAVAQTAYGNCGLGELVSSLRCPSGIVVPGTGAGGSKGTGGGGSGAASNVRWEAYPRLVDRPDGTPCIRTQYRAVPVDAPSDGPPWDPNTAGSTPLGTPVLPCPPAEQSAYSGAEAVALRAWEEVPLPAPRPQIAPGRAITGKPAYLETHNQTQFEAHRDTLVGTLEIHATGTYRVDWGDGETSGPHRSEGNPWPDGQIRHDYVNVGTYDVVVSETWTATWRIGPWSGTLRDLRTVGRIEDFPVQEIQAVVRS
jgi:hypothetical protein